MIANFGFGALVIAFLISLYGIGAAVYGARKNAPAFVDSARNAMLLTWPLVTLAALCIITLLVSGSYQIEFVATVTSNSMPLYLKITSLWGGQAGSLVFWCWLLSAFASAVTLRKWDRDREFLPWVIVVSLVTLAFFLGLVLFIENPFRSLWQTSSGVISSMFQPANSVAYIPQDGNGLNPLLRHWGMIIHPPMLYLGFVSMVIPYAFAMAALITGRTDDRWIRITRRWSLVAWLFLSLGLILGGRWAYDVLGWGGYWGWDPVEISAFMPWLTGTAFLHSVMIQEKRGMLKQWNMALVILTYDLVIFGTFLTRSGVLSSVHAFAQSSIGPVFFAFIAATFAISLGLLIHRWNDLKAEGEMSSLFSREFLFLINNVLFVLIAAVCFTGVLMPLISEIFTGNKMTVGPEWYQKNTGPLFAGLLLLMGIAPLSAWRYTSSKILGRTIWKPFVASLVILALVITVGHVTLSQWGALLGFWLAAFVTSVTLYEFWRGVGARHRTMGESFPVALWRLAGRNRRRYGGYTIHLGVVLMALGVIGIEMFQTQTQGTLSEGQSITLSGYTMKFDKFYQWDDLKEGRNIALAQVSVYKDGQKVAELSPHKDYYYEAQQPMTIPAVGSNWAGDNFYVTLVDWQPTSAQSATFKVFFNPLVNWLWLGGLVFILGTAIAAWPDRDPETAPARVRKQSYAAAKA